MVKPKMADGGQSWKRLNRSDIGPLVFETAQRLRLRQKYIKGYVLGLARKTD